MGHDNPNLSPMRGPSVWARPQWGGRSKRRVTARWLVGAAGTAVIAVGVQRRSRSTASLKRHRDEWRKAGWPLRTTEREACYRMTKI